MAHRQGRLASWKEPSARPLAPGLACASLERVSPYRSVARRRRQRRRLLGALLHPFHPLPPPLLSLTAPPLAVPDSCALVPFCAPAHARLPTIRRHGPQLRRRCRRPSSSTTTRRRRRRRGVRASFPVLNP